MPGRIMIVDDAAFMRMMLKDILTKNGYEVVAEASNGHEAVLKYEETRPDLVTMDITMPEMDGITAVKEIRKKTLKLKLSCAVLWGNKLWWWTPFKQEHEIL